MVSWEPPVMERENTAFTSGRDQGVLRITPGPDRCLESSVKMCGVRVRAQSSLTRTNCLILTKALETTVC